MRYGWFCGAALTLALVACGKPAGDASSSAPAASASPAGMASASVPAAADGAALLDSLVEPRQKGRYAPRDECGRQAGAAEFRRRLADAVARGDVAAIAALTSPHVRLGFAGDDGRERLIQQLSEPDSELMGELRRLLPMGCAINEAGSLTIPWQFAQDLGNIDGYSAVIVTGQDVPLHAAADVASAVTGSLSWDIVELVNGLDPERPLQQVRVPGGVTGFIATDRLRGMLDYRLLASREGDEWKITALVAGD